MAFPWLSMARLADAVGMSKSGLFAHFGSKEELQLAEMDTQPGPVRDRLVAFLGDWLSQIESAVGQAQAEGAIDPAEDPAQLTFEIEAALLLANAQYIVVRGPEPIERARRAIDRRLSIAAPSPQDAAR